MPLRLLLELSLVAAPDPHLHAAKIFYDEFQFARCVQQLSLASRSSTNEAELAEIELYGGLCRYNLGDFAGADEHFRIALRLSPQIALPPLTSPKIEARFAAMRAKAQAQEAEAPPPPADTPQAVVAAPTPTPTPTPTPPQLEATPPTPAPARHVGLAPILLGGGAVAAGAVSVFLGVHARGLAAQASAADLDLASFQLKQQAQGNATAANVGYAVAGALLLAGIVALIVELW